MRKHFCCCNSVLSANDLNYLHGFRLVLQFFYYHKSRFWRPNTLALGFQFPWKPIFRFRAQRSWETISNNFLLFRENSWEPIPYNVFNFSKSYIFFLTGSHKPVMYNAFWE